LGHPGSVKTNCGIYTVTRCIELLEQSGTRLVAYFRKSFRCGAPEVRGEG
jgi:hypothetical protein